MKSYRLAENKEDLTAKLDEQGKRIIRLGERKICLFLHQDEFYVFDHLCPHNKHPLFDGAINFQNEVVCPLHAYRFSLKDGRECENRTAALVIHKLKFKLEGVFLEVST